MSRWNSVMPNAMITFDAVATAAIVRLGSDAELDVTVLKQMKKFGYSIEKKANCFYVTFHNECFNVFVANIHSKYHPYVCMGANN